ncbi:MAG: transporter substrate-binding domain-containing protein [Myxococcales bacterium]|nr:transporter substrate-binding domain-containing protein [Myxococcales bacterium]
MFAIRMIPGAAPSPQRIAAFVALMATAAVTVACGGPAEMVVNTFPTTPRAVSEIHRGQADAVVGDYPVMAHTARESMGQLEVVGSQFDTAQFGIGIRKNSIDLKPAMVAALRKIVEDQSYIQALRNWAVHIGAIDPPAAPAGVPAKEAIPELQDGKLQVGIELDFAPMEFQDELHKPAGADVELATALAKALEVEVEFVNVKFDTLLDQLTTDKVDVVISAMTITPERSAEVDFIPYLEMGSGILVAKGNPHAIKTPQDLCGRTVALQEGTSQIAVLKKVRCWE